MNFIKKLKSKWGLESNVQIFLILLVFSCTGFTAVYVRRFIFALFGIVEQDPFWIKMLIWLLTILPVYYLFLLIYGALFGQFGFFWKYLKKVVARVIPDQSET